VLQVAALDFLKFENFEAIFQNWFSKLFTKNKLLLKRTNVKFNIKLDRSYA